MGAQGSQWLFALKFMALHAARITSTGPKNGVSLKIVVLKMAGFLFLVSSMVCGLLGEGPPFAATEVRPIQN